LAFHGAHGLALVVAFSFTTLSETPVYER
jgi:hypothetical protein